MTTYEVKKAYGTKKVGDLVPLPLGTAQTLLDNGIIAKPKEKSKAKKTDK